MRQFNYSFTWSASTACLLYVVNDSLEVADRGMFVAQSFLGGWAVPTGQQNTRFVAFARQTFEHRVILWAQ